MPVQIRPEAPSCGPVRRVQPVPAEAVQACAALIGELVESGRGRAELLEAGETSFDPLRSRYGRDSPDRQAHPPSPSATADGDPSGRGDATVVGSGRAGQSQ